MCATLTLACLAVDSFLECMLLRGTDYTEHVLLKSGIYKRIRELTRIEKPKDDFDVQKVGIQTLAAFVRDWRALYSSVLDWPDAFTSVLRLQVETPWKRASDVYKLTTFAPDLAWVMQNVRQQPGQEWRGESMPRIHSLCF